MFLETGYSGWKDDPSFHLLKRATLKFKWHATTNKHRLLCWWARCYSQKTMKQFIDTFLGQTMVLWSGKQKKIPKSSSKGKQGCTPRFSPIWSWKIASLLETNNFFIKKFSTRRWTTNYDDGLFKPTDYWWCRLNSWREEFSFSKKSFSGVRTVRK